MIRRHGYDVIAERDCTTAGCEGDEGIHARCCKRRIEDIQRRQKEMEALMETRKADIRAYLEAGQESCGCHPTGFEINLLGKGVCRIVVRDL